MIIQMEKQLSNPNIFELVIVQCWPGMLQVYKKGGTNQNKSMEMTYEQMQKELGLGVQIE